MTSPTPDQLAEIEFISGVTASGTVSGHSFDSWNGDDPASYRSTSDEAKWGAAAAGTGGELTVAFNPSSHWSATEQQAFVTAMQLWSAVADVRFDVVGGGSADLVISRGSDGGANEQTTRFYRGYENTSQLGTLVKTTVSIDTSKYGFGPITANPTATGGYPWMTMEHELGHAIGLQHAGPYNDAGKADTSDGVSLTGYDNRGWSLMSYHDDDWNHGLEPITPGVLDIAAVQRLYGAPTDSPLSGGGQVFGFNSNISGPLAAFYDFSLDPHPFATIWDGGDNNVLDLSGFGAGSLVSLEAGTLNNVGGLVQNLGIAFGTRIETVIGGGGTDQLHGNALGDLIEGGAGGDTLTGGSGNDHIYGNLLATRQGAADGDDVIDTGGGSDYVNGNAGNDTITAFSGSNRLYGGSGDDTIVVNYSNNHINGNLGNDTITAYGGNDTILGGQGDDHIHLGSGNTVVSGDMGDDRIFFGPGYVLATGGAGNDLFEIQQPGDAAIDRGGDLAGYVDEVTDFQAGADRVWLTRAITTVLHDPNGNGFGSVADARNAAQALLNADPGYAEVAAMQVGSDTYLFWNGNGNADAIDSGLKLDHASAWSVTTGSFTNDPGVRL